MSYSMLASDVVVLAAGAAASTAVAMASKNAPFATSLGDEDSDDSLCTPEQPRKKAAAVTAAPTKQAKKDVIALVGKLPAVEKKAVTTVTVAEVPLTPPVTEIKADGIFVQ